MIIVTTNELPGYRIDHVFGEVFGLTVRSRHLGSNIGAGLKSLAGGELRGITQLLHECREEALARLAAEAQGKGANAVVAFRFETTEYSNGGGVEVCAYGTAVGVRPLGSGAAQATAP
ncbi:heavy metal-binding domain-containing protein [Gordonia caeni]|uniref:UPF0145 protein GCM10022231_15410 n=1 Tax=Gordonia caeni TaxID=1007097 RepID=A0ABP7NZF1_9ACTN